MATFDNPADVNGKFAGTICLFDKKAITVKDSRINDEGKIEVLIMPMSGRGKWVLVDDPAFNYKQFNIGYANGGAYAGWWYRVPHRQYRQGLRSDQMGVICDVPLDHKFGFSDPFIKMLEDRYPKVETAAEFVRDGVAYQYAFHRDFAIAWDKLHRDYVIYYRGHKVGTFINSKLNDFNLLSEVSYVREALKEALP